MNGNNEKPKMPPPHERRIILPGHSQLPEAMGGPPVGKQPAGPSVRHMLIDTSKPPIKAAISFFEPPGVEGVPPQGVFWQTSSGGMVLSPLAEPPIRLLEQGEKPPENAVEADDPELKAELQADNVIEDTEEQSWAS